MACRLDGYLLFDNFVTTIKCEKGSQFKVTSIENISSVNTSFQVMNSPFIAGETIISKHDNARKIPIKISTACVYREFLIDFFRVGERGRLTILWTANEARYIDYIVESLVIDQPSVCRYLQITLTLNCPDVYFASLDDFGQNLADTVKLYATPFVWLMNKALVTDYAKFSREFAVSNLGDVPIGVYFKIKATGKIKNPQVIIDTNLFIRILIDMNVNDTLEISTITNESNDVFVKLNGENVLNKTDQNSTFFQLDRGKHIVSYKADDGGEHMQVFLSRRFLWHYV